MGINSYYFNNLDGRLINVENDDWWLTGDDQGQCLLYATSNKDSNKFDIVTDELVLWMDVNNSGTTVDGTSLTSLVTWSGTTIKPSSGITLCDFGLTGVDNGRYDMLSGITVNITSADTKVVLYPVTGYTVNQPFVQGTKGIYDYPWEYLTDTVTGEKECPVGDTICLNGGFYQGYFKLDFEEPNPIKLTATTDNCGNVEDVYEDVDPDATKYDLMPSDFDCDTGNGGWSMETWIKWDNSNCSGLTGNILNDYYSGNTGFLFYIGTRAENKFWDVFSGETGLYTCDGIIPLSPDEPVPETIDGQSWFSVSNFFGRSGSCCLNPCVVSAETGTTKVYCDELSENALGIRITPEGKVGYRKMTVTGSCYNNEFRMTGTTMQEGYSKRTSVFSGDNWTHLVVTYTQNSVFNTLPAGTLRFWVNGRVVYRVENFIGLKLRALNEYSSKQLGVPYNISWGGGTQGLVESQTFGGPDLEDRGLQLEKYFAGTFPGELSQLRFYNKALNILEIRNNLYIDSERYCVDETYGGSVIKQPSMCLDPDINLGTLITSDDLGVTIDLTAVFTPGSINAEYTAKLNKPLTKDLELRFKNELGTITGDPIMLEPIISIPKGELKGSTTILVDESYDRLTDEFKIDGFKGVTEQKLKIRKREFVEYKSEPHKAIYGCTDPEAVNFNPKANKDNGKCSYKSIFGCTDPKATNYNPLATVSDGSCIYPPEPPTAQETVYYGKLGGASFDSNELNKLNTKITDEIVNSYIKLEEGLGFGYILIPTEMEQPTLFRNSNEGCVGFAVPIIDMGEITLDVSGEPNNYKVYRTYVATHSSVDIWVCDQD